MTLNSTETLFSLQESDRGPALGHVGIAPARHAMGSRDAPHRPLLYDRWTRRSAVLRLPFVLRFIRRFLLLRFRVGKPDSLGFTGETATPQPSTTDGAPPC